MTVLTKKEILKRIEEGDIKIEPFQKSKVGPGSVDLHLDNKFRVFKSGNGVIPVNNSTDPDKYTKTLTVKDHLIINPGETVLGITKEKISLAPNLCGWLQGRSRFARLGLSIHVSANFIQPGVSNKQVLEIANLSGMRFALYPGTAICQIIFETTEGRARYKGKYANQKSV